MSYEKITLGTVCKGAAEQLFEEEFRKVMVNIKDPSTSHKKPRTITLTLRFDAMEDRSNAVASCSIKSSLAPTQPVVSPIVLTGEGMAVQGFEQNLDQPELYPSPAVAMAQ